MESNREREEEREEKKPATAVKNLVLRIYGKMNPTSLVRLWWCCVMFVFLGSFYYGDICIILPLISNVSNVIQQSMLHYKLRKHGIFVRHFSI